MVAIFLMISPLLQTLVLETVEAHLNVNKLVKNIIATFKIQFQDHLTEEVSIELRLNIMYISILSFLFQQRANALRYGIIPRGAFLSCLRTNM